MIGRREFVTLLSGAAAAWPIAAGAQQANRVARIGYLDFASPSTSGSYIGAFREGLRNLGYVEGENYQIEFRFAEDDNNSLPGLAIELIRLNVDVIVTYATGVPAAQRATSTIPIVMATYSDAVVTGIVASLANPGGNVTGSTFFNPELMAKRLELLKEIAPSMARAGVLLFRRSAINRAMLEAMERTANVLGVELQPIEIDRPTDMESAFLVLADQQVGGTRGWGSRVFQNQRPSDQCSRGEASASFDWTARTSHYRWADGLRSGLFRAVSPRRRLRGQDIKRN